MKKKSDIGDIILIPAGDRYVLAKVLYVSKWYKNLILLGLSKESIAERRMPSDMPTRFVDLIYTSQEPIAKKRWHSVGHEPLMEGQIGLAKRIVGGEVWLDDQCLGPATDEDFKVLPRMRALGAALVENRALSLLCE